MTGLQVVAPPIGELVLVAGDVAGEAAADDRGDAHAEVVAFPADPRDGEGLGPEFAVYADVHLRSFRLVCHTGQRMWSTRARTTRGLPLDLHGDRVCRALGQAMTSTDPRCNRQVTTGARDTQLTQQDAPRSLTAPVRAAHMEADA